MSKKKVRVYKGGGTVEPLYVGSKNNARYKAYQDSLNTYNQNSALLAKYQNTLVNPEDNAPLKQGKRSGNVTVFPYKNSPTERVLVQNPIMPRQQVVVGQKPPVPTTPQLRSAYPAPAMYGQGDYTVRDATNNAFYRYPIREQADSAVNSTMGQPLPTGQPVAQYKGGGRTPIYVNSPKDPRYRAYLDSLKSHDVGATRLKDWINKGLHVRYMSPMEGYNELGTDHNAYKVAYINAADPNGVATLYNTPVQPVVVNTPKKPITKSTQKLPILTGQQAPAPQQMGQYPVPSMPAIQNKEWYSNSQGIGMDASDEQVQQMYNEDGSQKYQYGGMAKKRVRITAPVQYEEGGTYDISEDEVARLQQLGYKLQHL